MPLKMPWWSSILLKTGQTTCYHIGDDGDREIGMPKEYVVLTTGQYSGTVNLDVPTYAAATISFTAPDIIADSANGLVTILNGDTLVIKGSASNDVVYTVASGGGTADHFHVAPNIVAEAEGAYISIYKRTTHSNNCVLDKRTGLIWSRTTSNAERVGPTSNGLLNWYDVATCFTLHPAAADLAIVAPNTLRIVGGAGELTRYHIGDVLDCAGFATAENNLPGFRVTNVVVNGADLDITLWIGNRTALTAEVAGGARSIALVCRSAFGYAAAANTTSLSGYNNWRIPYGPESLSIIIVEAPIAIPDPVAFPGWVSGYTWSSVTRPNVTTNALVSAFSYGGLTLLGKSDIATSHVHLVRP